MSLTPMEEMTYWLPLPSGSCPESVGVGRRGELGAAPEVGVFGAGNIGADRPGKNGKGFAAFPAEALGAGAVAELPSPLVVEGVLTAIVASTISAMDSRVSVGGAAGASERGVSRRSGMEEDGLAQPHDVGSSSSRWSMACWTVSVRIFVLRPE
jgi:hypothetical protein